MRTQDEIVAYLKVAEGADPFGFALDILYQYLDLEHLAPFLKPDAELEDFQPDPINRETVVEELRGYMVFAWEKATGHRGISAHRSIVKARAWLWLLGDDDLVAVCDDSGKFPQYGAPILLAICQKYGFPIPTDPAAVKMAAGEPCTLGCEQGCES